MVLDRGAINFIGARSLTNNTAELSALVEFCLWALFGHEQGNDWISELSLVVHCDSKYVIDCVEGEFRPKENVTLSTLARHLWSGATKRLHLRIVWVKGHSGNSSNDKADEAAKKGCDKDKCSLWWDRPFSLHELEITLVELLHAFQEGFFCATGARVGESQERPSDANK